MSLPKRLLTSLFQSPQPIREKKKRKKSLQSYSTRHKSEKDIHTEIQAIIRQITASVTFLPMLEDKCTFDLLVYTDKEVSVPQLWEESDPKYIKNSQSVKLRSFSTSIHKVDTMVAYKNDD